MSNEDQRGQGKKQYKIKGKKHTYTKNIFNPSPLHISILLAKNQSTFKSQVTNCTSLEDQREQSFLTKGTQSLSHSSRLH